MVLDSSPGMRMSCNGCRVLRKGCSASCSLRFCLQWIMSPESQANATVFLAKFYGRAGLINLIRAGPQHLRPAIFRSLLYEACGRIINPVYGSVGLLWSGRWQLCHSAVEAVLSGAPLLQAPSEAAAASTSPAAPPVKAYDIRHMSKADNELRKVNKARTRFKRPGARTRLTPAASAIRDREKREDESAFSAEAASHVSQRKASPADQEGGEVELTLTLGAFEQARPAAGDGRCDVSLLEVQTCMVDLCLQLPAPPGGLIR